jgi:glucose-6-phosphate 1-dehydrogenase
VNPPCHFAIFGAAGHLARTKLLPALYDLEAAGCLDERLCLTALARRDWDTDAWRAHLLELLREHRDAAFDAETAARLAQRFVYLQGEHRDPTLYRQLADVLDERGGHACQNVAFYLAVPPGDFEDVVAGLDKAGLNALERRHRIVVEKPFGNDLASARALNAELHRHYDETQIYRIDHYLGKETVQNLFVFRFANAVVEPLWNRHYVDHVQIILDERAGIGSRGGYFDQSGTLRDMVQSHLLQVLALTAMEPPASLHADELHAEKAKALRSIRAIDHRAVDEVALRAQYDRGEIGGAPVAAYREESGVAQDSTTETFVAMKLFVDNWRWYGVPFYLRSGKRLAARQSLVALRFRDTPHQLFRDTACENTQPNWLILSIQPEETIRFELQARQPGLSLTPRLLRIATSYRDENERPLDAYAALLLDVIEGDRSLFVRFDEVETAWEVIEPVLERWRHGEAPLYTYAPGSRGPVEADRLFERPHQRWREEP